MITVSEEDKKLFEQNGFSYEDVGNTVNHYRQEGLSDDDIQLKINQRISEFKTSANKPETAVNSEYLPNTEFGKYKKPNGIIGAFQFAATVPLNAHREQAKDNRAAELRTKGIFKRLAGEDLTAEEKATIERLDNPFDDGRYTEANNYGIYSKFKQTPDGEYFEKGNPAVIGERISNFGKELYVESMKQTAIMLDMIKEGGVGTVVGGVLGGGLGGGLGAVGGALTTGGNPAGAIAGARTGAITGAKIGANLLSRAAVARKSFEFETGFMRQELEQTNAEFIQNGIEPMSEREMDNYSLAVGAINAGLEYYGLGSVLKGIPGADKAFVKAFGTKAFKELIKDEAFRKSYKDFCLNLVKGGVEEGGTEMLQETVNFVFDWNARRMRDYAPEFAEAFGEKAMNIIKAGVVGSVCGLATAGVGTTAQVARVKARQGIDTLTAKKEAESMTIDERNEFLNENVGTLAEIAKENADNAVTKLYGEIQYNEDRESIREDVYNNLVRSGRSEEEAQEMSHVTSLFFEGLANADEKGRSAKEIFDSYNLNITSSGAAQNNNTNENYSQDNNTQNKINDLNNRRNELNLSNTSELDKVEEFENKSKTELLEQKRAELKQQGYSDTQIEQELSNLEQDVNFQNEVKEKSKYVEWQDNVDSYVNDYTQFLSDYCKNKGYIVETEKSNQSISTYVKLYKTSKQQQNKKPVYTIRISDHKNSFGDKDVMLHYATDINEALKAVDKRINNVVSKDFKKNFKGVVIGKKSINPELDFKGLETPQIQKKIKEFYKKYLQSSNENPNTKHIYKDGIGELYFSKALERKLSNKKDFEIAQILLSNIEEIINKGIVRNSNNKNYDKEIVTSVLYPNNNIFEYVLSVTKDSRGNNVIDIQKNISRANGEKQSTATADNNSITNSDTNVNPSEKLYQEAATAGAENNEVEEAKKEWKEKGTESKFFKKWFGNSKVVDENNKPLKLSDDKDIYITDGYSNNGISRYSYKGSHRAPSYAEGDVQERIDNSEDVNLEEVAQGFHNQPSDYFGPMGARYYGYDDVEGRESATAVRNITRALKEGQKNIKITVYRAVPKDVGNTKLKNGDWITLSKSYAKVHGESNLEDNYKIISQKVPISEVWWDGNDIREWGYDNGQEQKPDLYLSIQNPKYQDKLPENWKEARKLRDEGYDGVITSDGKYLVFEKMQIKSDDNRGTFDETNPNIYYQSAVNPKDDINQRTDKTKYLTDNEVQQVEKDKENFETYVNKLVNGELSYRTQIRVMEKLTSAYNNIPDLKGKKVVITQDVYKKIIDLPNKFNKNHNVDRKRAAKLPQLIADPLYILQSNSKGNEHRYVIVTASKGNKPAEKLSVVLNPNNNAAVVSAYDEKINISEEKKSGRVLYDKKKELSKTILTSKARAIDNSNTSITNSNNNFNPSSEIHNQDDNTGKFEDVLIPKNDNRGSIEFITDNLGNVRQTVIDLINGKADASTVVHEFGHLFLKVLIIEAPTNIKAREMLLEVNKWLRYNGKEYTRAQHEKFAKGFEAYVMSGKAPTSKLKQVFERFREWMKGVYKAITNDPDLTLTPEAEKVFNKIFGEEDYEQSKAEAKDIITRALAFANVKVKPTAEQLRYKNIAYEVLAYGLGKSTAYLKTVLESTSTKRAMLSKKRAIEKAILNIDDPYTGGDGMLPEWREFFSDPGVSYDNMEINSDYELAQAAYDVIVNKTYLKTNDEYAELQKSENAYQYILNSFKNAKNDHVRTTSMLAFYDWAETVPEMFQDTFCNKWVADTNEIERFEHLNKFEQAKELILKSVENLNSETEYRDIVQNVIKSLNFLSPADRNKILNNVLSITNVRELRDNIDELMDFAQTLEDVSHRKHISNEIQEEIKATKSTRKNGKTYGKYDYSTNKMFEQIRDYNRMTREEAEDVYEQMNEEFSQMSDEQRENMSFEEKLIRKFVRYKAYGNIYMTTDFLADLYADIVFAKLQGKLAKDEADFTARIENNQAIDKAVERLEKKKKGNILTRLYSNLCNLESFLNLFFDKSFIDEYSLLYEQVQKDTVTYMQKQALMKQMQEALNTKDFDGAIVDKIKEEYTVTDYSLRKPKEMNLNKMQIINAYIYAKNPVLKERLIYMFKEGGYDYLMSTLTEEEKKLGDLLQKTAESYYNELNKVYIRKYSMDMPKAKAYFPADVDRVQDVDMFNQFTEMSSSPGFFKSRVNAKEIALKLNNPVAMLFNHMEKANTLIYCEEKVSKINKILLSRDVAKMIEDKYGKEAYTSFKAVVATCSYTHKTEQLTGIQKFIDNIVNGLIVSTIALKPKITLTQLVSVINYSANMPAGEWFKGMAKALANPKATIDFMMRNEYLKSRYGSGAQNEALIRIAEASAFTKSRKYLDFFTLNVRLGDVGAIIFGGKPYVDYLISQGYTEEEAFKKFVEETNRAQQSGVTSSLASHQMSKNPLYRLYNAFQNTTNQYFRKVMDGFYAYSNGDMTAVELAKNTFIFTFANNFLYRLVSSPAVLLLGLTAGDWEDFRKETLMSIFDLNSQALVWIGQIYQTLLSMALDRPTYSQIKGLDKITQDFAKFFKEVKREDLEAETAIKVLSDVGDATKVPVSTIVNMSSSIGNIMAGEFGVAVMKLLGWSDYQSKKGFGLE